MSINPPAAGRMPRSLSPFVPFSLNRSSSLRILNQVHFLNQLDPSIASEHTEQTGRSKPDLPRVSFTRTQAHPAELAGLPVSFQRIPATSPSACSTHFV